MYSRRTRIIFAFMVFVMGIGFPLSLVAGFPAFQSLFTGSQSAQSQNQDLIDQGRATVRKEKCTGKPKPTGKRLTTCKRALEDLAGGYQSLAAPDQTTGKDPAGAEENRAKSLEAAQMLYDLDPTDSDSTELAASFYSQDGKYDQALPLYRKLAKDNPDDPDFIFAWAYTAQAASKNDEAIGAFKRYLKLDPNGANADTARQSLKSLKSGGGGGASSPVSIPAG